MKYRILYYKSKRPNGAKELLKNELLDYLKKEFKKGHILSRRELEKKFHFQISTIFKGINDLYKKANLKYKLPANQSIKSVKAQKLLEIVINNLDKFSLKLLNSRKINERGIDILAKKNNNLVGVEIKAYNKYEKLKYRDIIQVEKFIKKENLDNAIIITSANLKESLVKPSERVSIIMFDYLNEIIKDHKEKKWLLFIREYSINKIDSVKAIKKQKILNYVSEKYERFSIKPNYKNILKDLHLDLYTYFNNLAEIYKILRIPPPLKNLGGKISKKHSLDKEAINLWKIEFKKYILEIFNNEKRYPSGIEIAKKFGLSHIWNIVNVSGLYKELGLPSYLERKSRFTSVQES